MLINERQFLGSPQQGPNDRIVGVDRHSSEGRAFIAISRASLHLIAKILLLAVVTSFGYQTKQAASGRFDKFTDITRLPFYGDISKSTGRITLPSQPSRPGIALRSCRLVHS